ncbi:hypothetical protein NJ7G_2081 [Natrinema sp. J7-2]|nr:hypothetical protein NJ7G_2081 [Natrinema sp. J7-2]
MLIDHPSEVFFHSYLTRDVGIRTTPFSKRQLANIVPDRPVNRVPY